MAIFLKFKKLTLSALFIGVAITLSMGLVSCKGQGAQTAADLRGGETRATLPPSEFYGATAEAYRIAKEIPEVIDSLYCYCDCKKHFGHKSLLTCYVDDHAVHCDVCQDQAFMAMELHRQGMDAASIRKAVDARFSSMRH